LFIKATLTIGCFSSSINISEMEMDFWGTPWNSALVLAFLVPELLYCSYESPGCTIAKVAKQMEAFETNLFNVLIGISGETYVVEVRWESRAVGSGAARQSWIIYVYQYDGKHKVAGELVGKGELLSKTFRSQTEFEDAKTWELSLVDANGDWETVNWDGLVAAMTEAYPGECTNDDECEDGEEVCVRSHMGRVTFEMGECVGFPSQPNILGAFVQ